MSSLYYEEISDIKELEDVNVVNEHIHNGWVLLKVGERSKITSDPMTTLPVQEVSVVYILGLRKTGKAQTEPPKQAEISVNKSEPEVSQKHEPSQEVPITAEHLGQLPWKESAYGEWIFANAERYNNPTLSNFKKRIHAWLLQQCPLNKEWDSGGYTYQHKNENFISRKRKGA